MKALNFAPKSTANFAICTLIAGLAILFIQGCGPSGKTSIPDLSAFVSELEIIRLDSLLAELDRDAFTARYTELKNEKPTLFGFYETSLLGLPPTVISDTAGIADTIFKYFFESEEVSALHDTLHILYKNLDAFRDDIQQAFLLHRYYFGNERLPDIFTYSAPFGYPVALSDNWLAVSLDMFMGGSFSIYQHLQSIPRFQLARMEPENMPAAAMQVIGDDRLERLPPSATLLDHIIRAGKLMYYLDRVLPTLDERFKIGYTENELNWCRKNQVKIWEYLVSEQLLFSRSGQVIAGIVQEGPFTKGMGEDSPGAVGVWVGWQIVKAFMTRFPDTSLEALFSMRDSPYILSESHWKPKR